MASTKPKTSKRGAAGTITDITLTIPDAFEIIWKPGILQARVSLSQYMTLDMV